MKTSKDIHRCLEKSRTPSLRLQYNLQTVFTVHCQLSRCPKICALPAEHYVNDHTLETETLPTTLKKLFCTFSYAASMDLMFEGYMAQLHSNWLTFCASRGGRALHQPFHHVMFSVESVHVRGGLIFLSVQRHAIILKATWIYFRLSASNSAQSSVWGINAIALQQYILSGLSSIMPAGY